MPGTKYSWRLEPTLCSGCVALTWVQGARCTWRLEPTHWGGIRTVGLGPISFHVFSRWPCSRNTSCGTCIQKGSPHTPPNIMLSIAVQIKRVFCRLLGFLELGDEPSHFANRRHSHRLCLCPKGIIVSDCAALWNSFHCGDGGAKACVKTLDSWLACRCRNQRCIKISM